MFLQDIKYALRGLWSSRSFAAIAVLCLAFGIGLTTSSVSIVDGVILKPYPYKDSERLLVLQAANMARDIDESGVSAADATDLEAGAKAFDQIAALMYRSMTISDV